MSVGKIIWAALSVAVAFGINTQRKPALERTYDRSEYAQPTGKLSLPLAGGQSESPLVNVHIVTVDVEHVGKTYAVRELSLRGVANPGSEPSFEIFVNLPEAAGVDYALGVHDPARLRQEVMLVKPSGRLGSKPSYFTLEGGQRRRVVAGNLVLTEVLPFGNDAAHSGYRAEGRLNLELETETGAKIFSGKLAARIIWDED